MAAQSANRSSKVGSGGGGGATGAGGAGGSLFPPLEPQPAIKNTMAEKTITLVKYTCVIAFSHSARR